MEKARGGQLSDEIRNTPVSDLVTDLVTDLVIDLVTDLVTRLDLSQNYIGSLPSEFLTKTTVTQVPFQPYTLNPEP